MLLVPPFTDATADEIIAFETFAPGSLLSTIATNFLTSEIRNEFTAPGVESIVNPKTTCPAVA